MKDRPTVNEPFDQVERERTVIIEKLIHPVEQLVRNRPISGILLFLAVIIALYWANSDYKHLYHQLWETPLSISIGDFSMSRTLHHWINEGLMAIFFFVIGLEIKKELILGELSSRKKASLPVFAAIGGMIFPAIIYLVFNIGDEGEAGWGVPMATDIAFALGILSLLGKRVPTSLKIFLTALAIVDDLGAVLVIAFFYTENILITYLELGALFFVLLSIGNLIGIRSTFFYSILGIGGLWVAFLNSGVHATLAGVIVAMTIPVKAKINEKKFLNQVNRLLIRFKRSKALRGFYVSYQQEKVLEDLNHIGKQAESPLQNLEHALSPLVSFIVIPLFALVNSGIEFNSEMWYSMLSSIPLGIMVALVAGKVLGITGVSYFLIKSGISELPKNTNWAIMLGAGFLGGIGFTMSIFISELAFETELIRTQSKMAILLASTFSAIIGIIIIRSFTSLKGKKS